VAVIFFVGENRRTGENHRPFASHWQTLSHNVVHLALIEIPTLTTSVVIGTDCIGSCKSNYHAITATTAPLMCLLKILYHGLNNLWWRQNNLLWKKSNILMSKGQRPRMVDIGPVKWHYFKMNAETCFTPKSFLVKFFFKYLPEICDFHKEITIFTKKKSHITCWYYKKYIINTKMTWK
jgi:hypothetical protein